MTDRAAGSVTARSELDTIAGDAWETILGTAPLFATAIGDRRYAGLLADRSPAGVEAARGAFAGLLARLDALDPSPAEAVTHAAVREVLEGELTFVETGLPAWNVDPMDGIPVPLLQVADYQPVATTADRAALLERWRAMGPAVDEFATSVRARLADGLVSSRAPVERVIDILATQLAAPDAESSLAAPVARARATATDADAADLDPLGRRRRRCHRHGRPAGLRPPPRDARGRDPPGRAAGRPPRPAPRPGRRGGLPRGSSVRTRRWTGSRSGIHETGVAEIAAHRRRDGGARRARARDADPPRGDRRARAPTPRSTSRPATRSRPRPSRPSPARPRSSRRGSAASRRRPARSSAMGAHEEEDSTIAYYRQPGGRRLAARAATTSTRRTPETRPRYEAEVARLPRVDPRPPPPDRDRAGARGAAAIPAPPRPDGVRRGLGPVHRAAGRRDGPLHRRPRPDRHALVRRLARVAARGRHRHPRAGLDARAGDRRTCSSTRRSRENNVVNEVDRYIVWPGPGARLQDRPARDAPPARRGARARSARPSTSAPSTTRCWARARSPCRRCGRSSTHGSSGRRPEAAGPRGTDTGDPRVARVGAAQRRDPEPGAGLDDRDGRRLGAAGRRAAGRLRRGRTRAGRAGVPGPDDPGDGRQRADRPGAVRAAGARSRRRQPRPVRRRRARDGRDPGRRPGPRVRRGRDRRGGERPGAPDDDGAHAGRGPDAGGAASRRT